MKVDILLRTRDYDRDYRWIFKPEYVDRVTEDKMSFLIQMMQKSELKQYLENESLYNLYYLYDENGSALVRSGFSGSMDRQGRNIYAVEGIACPAEMNRLFWYALPYLVDWLLQQPMLREQWLRENDPEENADVEHHMEVEGLTEDMIFEGSAEEKQVRSFLATFGIDYDKLSKEQFVTLIEILKLSKYLKSPINQRGKARPQLPHGKGKRKHK